MDINTSIESAKKKVQKFCEDRDWDQFHGAKDLAIGLVTESSELLEHFRFKSDSQIDKLMKDDAKRIEISDELADTFFFLLRFAQMYGIDLSTALSNKIDRNALKYPIEKSKGRNIKYDELE